MRATGPPPMISAMHHGGIAGSAARAVSNAACGLTGAPAESR